MNIVCLSVVHHSYRDPQACCDGQLTYHYLIVPLVLTVGTGELCPQLSLSENTVQ